MFWIAFVAFLTASPLEIHSWIIPKSTLKSAGYFVAADVALYESGPLFVFARAFHLDVIEGFAACAFDAAAGAAADGLLFN